MNSIVLIFFLLFSCSVQSNYIRSGIDIFFNKDLSEYHGKRVSLVMNHTSVDRSGESLLSLAESKLEVVSIFTPEHGLFGKNEAGEMIAGSEYRDFPVHSLYGSQKGPSDMQLDEIDILIFDMQDIGSRIYTYVSTLTYVMKPAARNNVKLIEWIVDKRSFEVNSLFSENGRKKIMSASNTYNVKIESICADILIEKSTDMTGDYCLWETQILKIID